MDKTEMAQFGGCKLSEIIEGIDGLVPKRDGLELRKVKLSPLKGHNPGWKSKISLAPSIGLLVHETGRHISQVSSLGDEHVQKSTRRHFEHIFESPFHGVLRHCGGTVAGPLNSGP